MTKSADRRPSLTVWDLKRGTIRQFADAIAAERGGLSSDEVVQLILDAIWEGAFETADKSFVTYPEADDSALWVEGRGTVWRDGAGNEIEKPYPEFTRLELGDVACGISNRDRAPELQKRPPGKTAADWKDYFRTAADWKAYFQEWLKIQEWHKKWDKLHAEQPKYELLVGRSPTSFDEAFKFIFPRLMIETGRVLQWIRENAGSMEQIKRAGNKTKGPARPTVSRARLRRWYETDRVVEAKKEPGGEPTLGSDWTAAKSHFADNHVPREAVRKLTLEHFPYRQRGPRK